MMNIQKKTLRHVSNILNSIDTYAVYKELNDAMIEAGIDQSIVNKILGKYQSAIYEQSTKKVMDAKSWIDEMISDIQ